MDEFSPFVRLRASAGPLQQARVHRPEVRGRAVKATEEDCGMRSSCVTRDVRRGRPLCFCMISLQAGWPTRAPSLWWSTTNAHSSAGLVSVCVDKESCLRRADDRTTKCNASHPYPSYHRSMVHTPAVRAAPYVQPRSLSTLSRGTGGQLFCPSCALECSIVPWA